MRDCGSISSSNNSLLRSLIEYRLSKCEVQSWACIICVWWSPRFPGDRPMKRWREVSFHSRANMKLPHRTGKSGRISVGENKDLTLKVYLSWSYRPWAWVNLMKSVHWWRYVIIVSYSQDTQLDSILGGGFPHLIGPRLNKGVSW